MLLSKFLICLCYEVYKIVDFHIAFSNILNINQLLHTLISYPAFLFLTHKDLVALTWTVRGEALGQQRKEL